ncbi:winged helix-turn-helix domain-containing protein [Zooshikella sp. RANM57]|uniref:winged helix-turn-helix domain-containing protein n=1 Tax=Zooshikella sp. RANM57 TaxID=3425863 RepID=UPI003D6E4C5A
MQSGPIVKNIQFNINRSILTFNNEQCYLNHSELRALEYFLTKPNQIITKEELKIYIWKRSLVTDSSLTKTIAKLREHISYLTAENDIVVTIPRIGYKLVLDRINILCVTEVNHKLVPKNNIKQLYKYIERYKFILASLILLVFSVLNFYTAFPSIPKGYTNESYQLKKYTHESRSYSLITKKETQIDNSLLNELISIPCNCTYFIEQRAGTFLISFFDSNTHKGNSLIMPESELQQAITKIKKEFQSDE